MGGEGLSAATRRRCGSRAACAAFGSTRSRLQRCRRPRAPRGAGRPSTSAGAVVAEPAAAGSGRAAASRRPAPARRGKVPERSLAACDDSSTGYGAAGGFPVGRSVASRMPRGECGATVSGVGHHVRIRLRRVFGVDRATAGRSPVLRVERHRLGLRAHVLGRRIHEWHLGVVVFVAAAAAGTSRALGLAPSLAIGAGRGVAGREGLADLTRSRRDMAAWRFGFHRRPLRLRPFRRLDDVPVLAALVAAVVGVIDLVSAVTPNVSWRGRLLVHVEPVAAMQAAHALAVPVSFALIVTAYYLYRGARARSTWRSH